MAKKELVLNYQKTNYMVLGSPKIESLISFNPEIGRQVLKRVFNTQVLSIYFDSTLKFDHQITCLKKELNNRFHLFI